jgi:hypothetical protein
VRTRTAVAAALLLTCVVSASPVRADDDACIAANNQAVALRKQGKLHDTLKQLAVCADPSCPSEIATECSRRVGDIDAAMPTLILSAKDGSGNDLFSVTVSMDGAPLLTTLDGRPVALDPGEHAFRFEVPGQPPLEKQIVLREGEKDRHENVVLGPPPAAPVPVLAPAPAPTPEPSNWSTRRTLALVAGGAGVVGVGLGIVFGVLASSDQSQEKSNCSTSSCSNRGQASADYTTATQNATGSTVAFIAGGVLVAAGAVLWFTAPSNRTSSTTAVGGLHLAPSFTDRSGALLLGGAF